MKEKSVCATCAYYEYDEESESDICLFNMDEDELYRYMQSHSENCPYYRNGDEYKLAKKQ